MKPFLIGEIGINHNGDVELAKRLIDFAKYHKWDAVKFQKRDVEKVIPKKYWKKEKELPDGSWVNYIDYKKSLELSEEDYDEIDRYCKKIGINWFASAWDLKSQEFLAQYNTDYNKIASVMITYQPLLELVASEDKPTFISTGMAKWADIDKAVSIFKEEGCPFVLMHCVGLYPCPLEELNLDMIDTLREKYGCEVGYSGHSPGALDALIATAKGCRYIEKHITLDRSMWGTDQKASIELGGMEYISKHTSHIPIMLGDGSRKASKKETDIAHKMRWWEHEKSK